MAKVWLCRYGVPATKGVALTDRPFTDCVKQLRLIKTAYLGAVGAKVQFGNLEDAAAATHKGFVNVVVLLVEPEATAHGWKAGYYLAPVTPTDAAKRLGAKLPDPPPPTAPPPAAEVPAPAPSAAPASTRAPAPASAPTQPPGPTQKITV